MSLFPFILMLLLVIIDIFFAMAKTGSNKAVWFNLIAWFFVSLSFLLPSDMSVPDMFNGFIAIDKSTNLFGFALSIMMIVYLVSILFEKKHISSELLALGAFANFGLIGLSISVELLFTLILLEIASISTYALIILGENTKSKEAGLKYFLLSSLMSAFFLLGSALIFGLVGSTKYANLGSLELNLMSLIAIFLVLVMMFFKIAIFGFYRWSVDVYFGANTATTGFLASSFKIASFIMLIKFLLYLPNGLIISQILMIIAVLSMFIGNFLSIKETSVKKILIVAGIVHAGYIFINLSTFNDFTPAYFYMATYGIVVGFAFAILGGIFGSYDAKISDLSGLYKTHPVEAFAFLVINLSFIGFPYCVGFLGKVFIFSSAFENGYGFLAVFGILNTILSVYYYFRIIIAIYFSEKNGASDTPSAFCEYKQNSFLALKILSLMAVAFIIIEGSGKFSILRALNLINLG